jgi:hypothetical protein
LLSALRHRWAEVLTVYLAEQHSIALERTVRQLGVLYYTEKPPDWDTLSRVLASVLCVYAPASSLCVPPIHRRLGPTRGIEGGKPQQLTPKR